MFLLVLEVLLQLMNVASQVQSGIWKQGGRSGCSSNKAQHFYPEANFR